MKVKKELAEMHDGTVQLLSLVNAGASGAPFKRLKSEESEGDADVFTPEKNKPVEDQPKLIALAVTEGGDVAAARANAEAAGIEVVEERETEGTTLLVTKSDARINTLDPTQIQVQLSEDLIAVCQVEKSFIPFTGSTSFADAIKAQGFFPQLSNALEVLGGVTYQILESASSPSVAAAEIAKSGEEFVALLTSMTKALPKETFKMAEQLKAIKEEPVETTEEVTAEATEETEAVETEKEETSEEAETETEETVEKEDETTEEAEATEETEVEKTEETAEATEETETEEVAEESELTQVLKAIEALTATVAEQGKDQAALKEQVEAVATKADSAEERADEVETAVKGRVSTSPAPDGRNKEDVATQKAPPLADTGMSNLRKR